MRVTALAAFSEATDKEQHKAETSRVRSVHGAVTEQSGGQRPGGGVLMKGPCILPTLHECCSFCGAAFPPVVQFHPSVCTCPSLIILHVENIQVLQMDACTCKRVLSAQGDIAASTHATH